MRAPISSPMQARAAWRGCIPFSRLTTTATTTKAYGQNEAKHGKLIQESSKIRTKAKLLTSEMGIASRMASPSASTTPSTYERMNWVGSNTLITFTPCGTPLRNSSITASATVATSIALLPKVCCAGTPIATSPDRSIPFEKIAVDAELGGTHITHMNRVAIRRAPKDHLVNSLTLEK